MNLSARSNAIHHASHRTLRKMPLWDEIKQKNLKVTEIFGENTFNLLTGSDIPDFIKKEIKQSIDSGTNLSEETTAQIAELATEWATRKGATHFCHWFQPLTGSTAEKHDAFLSFSKGEVIEKLTPSQLKQGEPDASSFPHGGSRSTFEARGYTSWDFTSPMFIKEGVNGRTLCIPTAFVSYHGGALDMKTPLLRSVSCLNKAATEFLNLTGKINTKSVNVTAGLEQEYFLIDKAFYALRPDLVMTGRTLLGTLPSRNQQLEDHYFGTIPQRVEAFMQELEYELYRLGIPAKTRHNEVAPGQFEIAPIFEDCNIGSDHNQLTMAMIKEVAARHNFQALLHEKPFVEINGSGKHLNWSMADNEGYNLLEPGDSPVNNERFLATLSIVMEAVHRHAAALRASIADNGNDHRLGANEAPPSIISVFIGDTLGKIFEGLAAGKEVESDTMGLLDLGAGQLMALAKDNTDRNRTSPFAFTGNKFEFRAVGSNRNVAFPLTILNTAVADVFAEANEELKKAIDSGKDIKETLTSLTKKYAKSCKPVIFNGDGYSSEWVKEAEKRGLPNLMTTPDALSSLADEKVNNFLVNHHVLSKDEISTRLNVFVERYINHRKIEFQTLGQLVRQYVLPAAFEYKRELSETLAVQKEVGMTPQADKEVLQELSTLVDQLYSKQKELEKGQTKLCDTDEKNAHYCAKDLLKLSEEVTEISNKVEELVPDRLWELPKYYDMLFIR